jgi:hypothetical protein
VLALVLASAEPSKVPFYIVGALLAVWAVALSWIGITQPEFPGTVTRMRAVIGITLVLAVAAIGLAIHTSAFVHV